jgi:hypothetical protein
MFCSKWKPFRGREVKRGVEIARKSIRPYLEGLEDRLTPSFVPFVPAPAFTITTASVQVTPSLLKGTVTETVTATVMNDANSQGYPTPAGTVDFSLNSQHQTATLDGNGRATVSFTMPLLSVLSKQDLTVSYGGGDTVSPFFAEPSSLNAAVYMNFDNLIFTATLTFSQVNSEHNSQTFSTANGETDSIGPIAFLYSNSLVINQVEVFGFTLPGFFAAQLGAYGPPSMNSNSSG